jgi:hypothetical protein
MSSNSDPTAALALGFFAGIWIFFKGFKVFREYKIVADTPRIPIRSAPLGLVRVRGKAQSEQVVPSPVSHTHCCFYKVEIDMWKTSERSGGWQHFRTDVDGAKFYLVDETGTILVDGHAAEYDLLENCNRQVDSSRLGTASFSPAGGATDAELLQYIAYSGVHKISSFVEHWLEKKGPLDDPSREQTRQTLLGIAQAVPKAAMGGSIPTGLIEKFIASRPPLADPQKEMQRQEAIAHFRQMAQTGQLMPVQVTESVSGRYRLREYLILPGVEYDVTGSCMENPNSADAKDRTVLCKGQNEKTFMISYKDGKELEGGLRRHSLKMILGGAVLSLACLAVLLWHLNLFQG